jgi:hypothetical protein
MDPFQDRSSNLGSYSPTDMPDVSIELPTFRPHSSAKKDHSHIPSDMHPSRRIVESPNAQLISCGFSILDLILNHALLYYAVLDEKFDILPRVFASTIGSNGPLWMSLSIISLVIESGFLFELGVRMWAWGPFEFLMNGWNVFDALIVISLLPLKLSLRTDLSLVTGCIVILRCWRLRRYTQKCVKKERRTGERMMRDVVKDANEKIAKEKSIAASYFFKLNTATSKLNKLLG